MLWILCSPFVYRYIEDYLHANLMSRVVDHRLVFPPIDHQIVADMDTENDTLLFVQDILPGFSPPTGIRVLVLNIEQYTRGLCREMMQRCASMGISTVLDYSSVNVPGSIYFPYTRWNTEVLRLQHLLHTTPKIYDIVVVGTRSLRREQVLHEIARLRPGTTFCLMDNMWGEERDQKIAGARVMLNIHFADDYGIYESIRCDRWVFAGMPVITETAMIPEKNEHNLEQYMYSSSYTDLPTTTVQFLEDGSQDIDPDKWKRIQEMAVYRDQYVQSILKTLHLS